MDTRRLILVMIFTFSSFMLWENWQKHNQPQPAAAAVATAPGAAAGTPTPSATLQAGTAGAAATAATAPTVRAGETFSITTDLLKATISTQGGDIVGLELLNYKEHNDKSKNFVLFDSKHQYLAQSGLIGDGLPNHRTLFARAAGPVELATGANELKVRLEADGGDGVKVAKVLTFKRNSYLVDVAWEIDNAAGKPLNAHAYYQLQREIGRASCRE